MSYHVFIINPDGSIVKSVQPKQPSYEKQREIVQGYIQEIPEFKKLLFEGIKYTRGTAIANEEGFLRHLPLNLEASMRWRYACPKGDPERMILCGVVLFYAKVKEEEHKQV